jgi:hypothetical protein
MSIFWSRYWKASSSGMPEATLETGSNKARISFSWAHQAWELRTSTTPKPVPKASSDEARGEEGPSATSNKEAHTTHKSLFVTDRHISGGSHGKFQVCWLRWKTYLPRKRMKMIIDMLRYRKHADNFEKDILVTTTIEVILSSAPSSVQSRITSSHEPSQNAVDLASDEEQKRQDLDPRPITAPSRSADNEAGAERARERRHSVPTSRPFSFHQMIYLGARPRSSYHTPGRESHSILAQEVEWAECLERATVISATSVGTEEPAEKEGIHLGSEKRTRHKLRKGLMERLGFGRRMRRKLD